MHSRREPPQPKGTGGRPKYRFIRVEGNPEMQAKLAEIRRAQSATSPIIAAVIATAEQKRDMRRRKRLSRPNAYRTTA